MRGRGPGGLAILLALAIVLGSAPHASSEEEVDFSLECCLPPTIASCEAPASLLFSDWQAFTNCISGEANEAVSQAVEPLNEQISAFVPLTALFEQLRIADLQTCLEENNQNLQALVSEVAGNPTEFVETKLVQIWKDALDQAGSILGDAHLIGGDRVQIAQRAEQHFRQLAGQDPAAACALGFLPPSNEIQEVALGIFAMVESAFEEVRVTELEPAIKGKIDAEIGDFMSARFGSESVSIPLREQPKLKKPEPSKQPKAGVPTTPLPERVKSGTPVPIDRKRRPESRQRPQTAPVRPSGAELARRMKSRPMVRKDPRTGAVIRTRGLLDDVAWVDAIPDTQHIALGIASDYLLNPEAMQELSEALTELSEVVGGPSGDTEEAYRRFEGAMDRVMAWDDDLALQVGIEIVRYEGHWVIDEVGGVISGAALSTISALVKAVVDWVASLGWAIVEAVVDVIATIVVWLCDWILLPAAEKAIELVVSSGWDGRVDSASQSALDGSGGQWPSAPFPTREQVVDLGLEQLAEMRDTMKAYHEGVASLARSAAQ